MRWEQWRRRRRKSNDTRNLIVGLVSRDPAQRYASEQVLLELGPDGVSLLLAELNLMGSVVRRLPGALAGALGAGCLMDYLWLLCGGPPGPAFLPGVGVLLVLAWELRRSRNATARLLAQVEDHRIVGPLAEALEYGDAQTRDAARQCLLRLLPQLSPADAFRIEPRHRRRLNRMLLGEDEPLILAVLRALPRIGDSTALSPVRLLKRRAPSKRVRRAAAVCLPALRVRIEERRISGSLLRPASERETATGALLRPVTSDPNADRRDLLRTIYQETYAWDAGL